MASTRFESSVTFYISLNAEVQIQSEEECDNILGKEVAWKQRIDKWQVKFIVPSSQL